MIFLTVGGFLLLWVFLFIAWGIQYNKPKYAGGFVPNSAFDPIWLKPSCYYDYKIPGYNLAEVALKELLPPEAYNQVIVNGDK